MTKEIKFVALKDCSIHTGLGNLSVKKGQTYGASFASDEHVSNMIHMGIIAFGNPVIEKEVVKETVKEVEPVAEVSPEVAELTAQSAALQEEFVKLEPLADDVSKTRKKELRKQLREISDKIKELSK